MSPCGGLMKIPIIKNKGIQIKLKINGILFLLSGYAKDNLYTETKKDKSTKNRRTYLKPIKKVSNKSIITGGFVGCSKRKSFQIIFLDKANSITE